MFGWCLDSKHKECRKSIPKVYFGKVKQGRKMVEGLIETEETVECDCTCHRKDKK